MVVQDQLDRGIPRIGLIKLLEERHELARAVAILDPGMHEARQQVDPGQQAECAVAFVVVIARKRPVLPRLRR